MRSHGGSARPLEFVAVGHVTVDHASGAMRLGGAAAFASLTAASLGLSTGCLTSVAGEFPFWELLEGIEVHYVEAERTTEFVNLYQGTERRQRLLAQAAPLDEAALTGLRECARLSADAAVLYCPVVHEVRMPLAPLSPRGLCGVAPQGFYRSWNDEGIVAPREWEGALAALAQVDFVSMSEDDHVAPEELAEEFAGTAFAVTKGARGSRVYSGTDVYDFPAFGVSAVDPTGAGDVYAAAFLVALREAQPVSLAARFASAAASLAVEGPGVASIAPRALVDARLRGGAP